MQLDLLEPSRVLAVVTGTVRLAFVVLSMALLVGLIMIFILAESTVIPFKFRAIFGPSERGGFDLMHMVRDIQAYVGIKTLVSAGTGVSIGLLCWLLDVDFPILLGLVAFILNFVPQIGSLIAAIPALPARLHHARRAAGARGSVGVYGGKRPVRELAGATAVRTAHGLSVLVVFLSLLFWAWVWGPVGALLAVPLTMVVKIAMEHVPDLRWIAALMDRDPPPAGAPPPEGGAGQV